MRFLPAFSLVPLALLASPAIAQSTRVAVPASNADTLKQVTEHGVVILTADLEIDVKFSPDGRFIALGGLSKGVWKIVGDKLCSTPDETQAESCAVYPPGKKSGDTFEIPTDAGPVSVKIK
ncbi:MAG TPA: hypothetical protein VGO52_00785 [Hyphomonadaceae bacterium]|jgi:hypothetical protein|nr:hypothetical protein [Hyphomonadaceae bacterium]